MTADLDIRQAADLLMKLHGGDAASVADKRAELRMLCGDRYGMLAWKLIRDMVETPPQEHYPG